MEEPSKKIKSTEASCKIVKERQYRVIDHNLSYDILRIIFGYLGARDLHSSAKVCRVWREAAENELNIRSPEYILKHFKQIDTPVTKDTHDVALIGNTIRFRPSLGLFCTKVDEAGDWKPEGCFCKNLPSKCSSVILGGYSLVANGEKVDDTVGTALCAFIPKIRQLKIDLLDVGEHTFQTVCDMDYDEHVKQIVNKLLPGKNENSKCIIMLANGEASKFMKSTLDEIKKRFRPGTISLWGGICVDLKVCNTIGPVKNCMQPKRWVGIGLSSPHMQSWSIVIQRTCRSQKSIEVRLESLKKSIILRKQSLGFMFACCARIDQKELETAAFKNVFPEIPIVGLHGDGEYGLNSFSGNRNPALLHQYSTIFMILTYD